MIQQSKIEVLDVFEVDFVSGGSIICSLFNWCEPPYRVYDFDPMEPISPDLGHHL